MKRKMKKIVILWILCFCMIFAMPSGNISVNISKYFTAEPPQKSLKCNTSYDCLDPRTVCSKNRTCACAKFHEWEKKRKKCVVSLTKIHNWLKATMSTVPEAVSQQEDFDVEQINNLTILHPKWAEYVVEEEKGIDRITRAIWPILFGVVMIILVYGAILLEFM